jgi:phenylacetate-CoA ligase
VILEPELETLPRDDLRALQARRLGELVEYLRVRVPFYRDALSAAGVQSGEVTSLDDLGRPPFTRS